MTRRDANQSVQRRVVVQASRRLAPCEYCARASLLSRPKLLSQILDAIERPVDAPVPKEYVASLLRRIGRATRTATPIVGIGQENRLESSRLVGSELFVGEELVALSVFPRSALRWNLRARGSPLRGVGCRRSGSLALEPGRSQASGCPLW